ncbi:MAG: hypothetical protein H7Y15_01620 [Pseudonocardia sp.]|nr:hypothetical protein [Pseudonocardia sp.]
MLCGVRLAARTAPDDRVRQFLQKIDREVLAVHVEHDDATRQDAAVKR